MTFTKVSYEKIKIRKFVHGSSQVDIYVHLAEQSVSLLNETSKISELHVFNLFQYLAFRIRPEIMLLDYNFLTVTFSNTPSRKKWPPNPTNEQ